MRRVMLCILLAFVVLWGAANCVPADEKAPSVTVMHASADVLVKDLELLARLASAKEQAGWKKVIDKDEGVLEIFLLGIDRTRPVSVDVLLGGPSERLRMNFPIDDFKFFVKENLGGFGIKTKKLATNFFHLEGEAFTGYLRYGHKYASIAEDKADVSGDLSDPAKQLKPLLDKKYSVAAVIQNEAEGADARRKSIQQLRKNLSGALKKKSTESEEEFALRQAALASQMDELEWFFAEASRITLGIVTDHAKKEARMDLDLQAIPGTSLEKDIQDFGKQPSSFASIPKSDSAIFFGRLNFPLNDMRKKNLLNEFEHARAVAVEKLQEDTKRSEEQRQKGTEAIDAFFDMLKAGTENGVIDAFLEVRQNAEGKRLVLAANRAPDGTQMLKVLELLAGAKSGRALQANVATVGDVTIHRFESSEQLEFLKQFWGDDTVFFVGCGPETIWYAAGPDALEQLKASIQHVAADADGSESAMAEGSSDKGTTFAELSVQCGPWAKFIDQRIKQLDAEAPAKKLTDAEKAAKAESARARQLAIEAFQSADDTITLELKSVDDRIVGQTHFGQGLLLFVSKIVADFANENL